MGGRSERVPVDLDRLADHAAGLLDGTPGAAEVERLLATDPAWAAAAAELRAADPRVRAELAALASPEVPAEVAARIDRILAGEGPAQATPDRVDTPDLTGAPERAGMSDLPDRVTAAGEAGTLDPPAAPEGAATAGGHGPERPEAVRTGAARPAGRSGPGGPGRRPRRRRGLAWAGAAALVFAVAAGTVTAATLGRQHVTTSGASQSTVGRGAAPAATPEAAGSGPRATGARGDSGTPRITASGTDYQPATLADAARATHAARDSAALPHSLSGLGDPAALNACLLALTGRYGGTVSSVDFARFQGAPAVVVVLAGQPVRVVAVGPRCGAAGAGTDEIYETPA